MTSLRLLVLLASASAAVEPHIELGPLLEAVLSSPDDTVARARLRQAALGLAERSQDAARRERLRLLDKNADTLASISDQAEQWGALLDRARSAGEAGLWALSLDLAGKVLDENPRHALALEASAEARRGMARALDEGPPSSDRTTFLYKGLLAFTAADDSRAERMLKAALGRPEPPDELYDARIREYLDVLDEVRSEAQRTSRRRRARPPKPAPSVPVEAAAELAAERAEAALRPSRAEAAALYDRGIASFALDRLDEARTFWQAALKADPGHAMARRALEHLERRLSEAPR